MSLSLAHSLTHSASEYTEAFHFSWRRHSKNRRSLNAMGNQSKWSGINRLLSPYYYYFFFFLSECVTLEKMITPTWHAWSVCQWAASVSFVRHCRRKRRRHNRVKPYLFPLSISLSLQKVSRITGIESRQSSLQFRVGASCRSHDIVSPHFLTRAWFHPDKVWTRPFLLIYLSWSHKTLDMVCVCVCVKDRMKSHSHIHVSLSVSDQIVWTFDGRSDDVCVFESPASVHVSDRRCSTSTIKVVHLSLWRNSWSLSLSTTLSSIRWRVLHHHHRRRHHLTNKP